MTLTQTRFLIAALGGALSCALLAGCAGEKPKNDNTVFDFGPAMSAAAASASPWGAVVVTEATGSAVLDNERMYYRLNYADPLQARTYANSRWSATPLQLVTQRLKTRIAQSGTKVLTSTDATAGVAILRTEVVEFTHSFDNQSQSQGQLVLRASLVQGHKLVDQKTFTRKTAASSADAAGGARALAGSTDAVAADIVAWLATLPVRRN